MIAIDKPQETEAGWQTQTFGGVARVIWKDHGTHLEISNLAVINRLQGQGIGSQIMRHFKSMGKPILLIPVAMDAGRDQDLLRFYARHGFQEQYPGSDWLQWTP